MSADLSFDLSVCLSIYLYFYLSRLSAHLCLSVFLSIFPCICFADPINQNFYHWIHQCVYPSIWIFLSPLLSARLSLQLLIQTPHVAAVMPVSPVPAIESNIQHLSVFTQALQRSWDSNRKKSPTLTSHSHPKSARR